MIIKYKAVKVAQLLLASYIIVVTFTEVGTFGPRVGGARDPETGFIIDPDSPERTEAGLCLWNGDLRAVIAWNHVQMILLGFSRFSGFFMYPALVLVYLTKLRATSAFLATTPFSMFMYQDMHRLHVYSGWVIILDSLVHATCHIMRWVNQGNLHLLWENRSGLSGLVIIFSMLLICFPMLMCKDKIMYEIRKGLHYFFMMFGIALSYHAPPSSVPNGGFCAYVFPVLLFWNILDGLYCFLFMTERIETTVFQTLPSGVQMTMPVSPRFESWGAQGGYGYICLPWVDRSQWHAFSLFEKPNGASRERQVFMRKVGDWTNKVHELLQRDTVRPVWIQGPFPSPYNNAINYDYQILVASGIGITPALSVIRAHKDFRRINLIWAVRDPCQVKFFLEHAYLDHRGWNLIFYTGKKPLPKETEEEFSGTTSNVCIIKARPKLEFLIPNIIYGIESGVGLPERYHPDQRQEARSRLRTRSEELDESTDLTPTDKFNSLAKSAEDMGYELDPLVPRTEPATDDDDDDESFSDVECGTVTGAIDNALARRVGLSVDLRVDKSWNGLINDMTMAFQPWEEHAAACNYVKNLDKEVKSTWGILYCGGRNPLRQKLKLVAKANRIKLHEESFAW